MKKLIFDFNGTIVNDLPLVMEIMTESLIPKGIDLSKYPIDKLRQKGVKKFMEEISISKIELLWLFKDIKKKIRERQADCPLVKDIDKYLTLLSKKYALYIFSSNSPQTIKDYLNTHGIGSLFQGVYEDDSYFGKDVGLKKILKELNILPSSAVYFGDESRDIEAAKKVGIDSVAVTWGFEGETPLSDTNPDYLISQPEEITGIAF